MKKLFALAISLSLCLTMAACGGVPKPTDAPAPTAAEATETPVPTAVPTAEPENAVDPIFAPLGKDISADLDGDGAEETILWNAELRTDGSWAYDQTLTVNGTEFAGSLEDIGYYCENVLDYWAVVDLDTSDSYREIAIFDDGPSSDANTIFFRYADGKLTLLGRVYGYPDENGDKMSFPGDNTVESWTRLYNFQTWFAPARWVYDESAEYGNFRAEPMGDDGLYYPNGSQELTALKDLHLYADKAELADVTTLTAGTQFTTLATDGAEWVLIETSELAQGWLHTVGCCEVETTSGAVYGGEAIDGLIFAD